MGGALLCGLGAREARGEEGEDTLSGKDGDKSSGCYGGVLPGCGVHTHAAVCGTAVRQVSGVHGLVQTVRGGGVGLHNRSYLPKHSRRRCTKPVHVHAGPACWMSPNTTTSCPHNPILTFNISTSHCVA